MQFSSFLYIKIIWANKSAINLEGSQNLLLKRGSALKLTFLKTLKRKGSSPNTSRSSMSQCFTYHVGEYIAKRLKRNLSEIIEYQGTKKNIRI